MNQKRVELEISVGQLELGMRVLRLDRPWLETDFLVQGFIIQDQDDIDSLQRQCRTVFIEATAQAITAVSKNRHASGKGKTASKQKKLGSIANSPPAQSQKVAYINKISTEQELKKAKVTYSEAKLTVTSIMDGIRLGRTIDMHECRTVVNEVVDSIIRNKDALAWLTKIKQKDEYTAEHSLNVCILSATFARYLGHSDEEIRQIGLCGLLHDVGKAKIPDEILNKEGRFTPQEFDMMKQHTTFGRDLLMSIKNTDRICIDVAHAHHERMDGSGYPRGLASHQIPYYAKIIALADCYDAITSARCYDNARSSMEALDIVYKCKDVQFDEELALDFIQCIGVYPPGAIVELSNGEVAIIISTNVANKLRPKILVVRDKNKKTCRERVVNLSESAKDSTLKISKELANQSYGVDLREYLERGLVIDSKG